MLYHLYELNSLAVKPYRGLAKLGTKLFNTQYNPFSFSIPGRFTAAACDLFLSLTQRYSKPEWGIKETKINGYPVAIDIEVVWKDNFCDLIHFKRRESDLHKARNPNRVDPRVLLVAPMSGHYATLLRGTVEAMLPEHEVYITDWLDARDVPVSAGKFDLNTYIDYVIECLHAIGPKANVIAICQPGPPTMAAISYMAAHKDPFLPASMIYMGSPLDTRRSPTVPNILAQERPYSWFEKNVIYTVPPPNRGAFRKVYPGFLQLGGFITMNQDLHVNAHKEYFEKLVSGDCDSVQKHREFYDEYLAVLDMTAEFYLQTIKDVFQEQKLPKGEFMHRGEIIRPDCITNVALMTVEGERDDIAGIGQTQAAHDLCANIPESMRIDYIQPGVGHYGIFNGSRFRSEVQPRMRDFIRSYFDPKLEVEYLNGKLPEVPEPAIGKLAAPIPITPSPEPEADGDTEVKAETAAPAKKAAPRKRTTAAKSATAKPAAAKKPSTRSVKAVASASPETAETETPPDQA